MKEPYKSMLIVVVLSLLFVGVELQLTKHTMQHRHDVMLEPEITVTVEPEVSQPPHHRATLDQPEVHLSEALRKKASDVVDTTKEKIHDVKEKVHDVKESVVDTLSNTKHKIHTVKDTIEDKMKEKAKHAKDVVEETAHDIKEKVKDTAENVKDTVENVKDTVEEKAQAAKDKLKNTAKAVQHKLHNTRVHWTEAVGEWKDAITNRMQNLWNGFKNSFVRKPLHKLHHVAEKDLHKAQDRLDSLRHTVNDRIKHVQDSALHTLHELEHEKGMPIHRHSLHEVVTDASGDIIEDYTVSYEYHYKRTVKPSKPLVQSYLAHT